VKSAPLSMYSQRVQMIRPSFMTDGAHSLREEKERGRRSEPSGAMRKRTAEAPRKQKTRAVQRVEMKARSPSGSGQG